MSQFSHVAVPPRSFPLSMITGTPSSPDGSIDYKAVTRPKNHKWTLEEQVTLVLLHQRYRNSWNDKTRIFNAYVEDELKLSHRFSDGALRSMFKELENKFNNSLGSWPLIRERLECKARSLNIPLESCAHGQAPRTPIRSRFDRFITGYPTPTSVGNCCRRTRLPRLGFRAFDWSKQGYIGGCRQYCR